MKNLFILFLTLLSCQFIFSQGTYTEAQRKKDKAKLDSICRKSPNSCIYYSDVIGVNSVFRKFAPRNINRTQKICFNKKFEYISTVDGKTNRGCFYINTITGYVAQFSTNDNNSCAGMNNPQPGFDMIISSKIGESFTFRINNRGEKSFIAQMPIENVPYGGATNFVVKNVNSLLSDFREPFTNQNLPTLPYFIDGITTSSAKYLFGPYHAQRIPLKDYIGAFGLGYYTDGMGNTFISLAVESIDQFVKVLKITDVTECFDGSKFKDGMEESVAINEQSISERKKGLENETNSGNNKNCEASKLLLQHERQILEYESAYNSYLKGGGNPMSKEGLKIGAKAQDVINQVITHRLKSEERICDLEYSLWLIANQNSSANKITINQKMACHKKAIDELNNLKTELSLIDTKAGTNYAKAGSEKNVLYFQKMRSINLDCNFKKGQLQSNPMDKGAKEIGDLLKEMMKRK